jgi:hypothetical protein
LAKRGKGANSFTFRASVHLTDVGGVFGTIEKAQCGCIYTNIVIRFVAAVEIHDWTIAKGDASLIDDDFFTVRALRMARQCEGYQGDQKCNS